MLLPPFDMSSFRERLARLEARRAREGRVIKITHVGDAQAYLSALLQEKSTTVPGHCHNCGGPSWPGRVIKIDRRCDVCPECGRDIQSFIEQEAKENEVKVNIELMPQAGEIAALSTLMQFLLTFPAKWETFVSEIEQKLEDLKAEVEVVKDDMGKAVAAMTDSQNALAALKDQNATLQMQIADLIAGNTSDITPAQLQEISDGLEQMNTGLKTAAAPLEAILTPPQTTTEPGTPPDTTPQG